MSYTLEDQLLAIMWIIGVLILVIFYAYPIVIGWKAEKMLRKEQKMYR